VWMGAVEKDVSLILFIMSITKGTSRGGIVSPCHSFNSSVGTKSEASHAANNVARKVKKLLSLSMYLGRVYGECVTRALLVWRSHN